MRVGKLLEGGPTHDRAVAIALINSRTLRQTYEELGVGQAEMLEAGLLENPRLSVDLGFPINPGGLPELETSSTSSSCLRAGASRRSSSPPRYSAWRTRRWASRRR